MTLMNVVVLVFCYLYNVSAVACNLASFLNVVF